MPVSAFTTTAKRSAHADSVWSLCAGRAADAGDGAAAAAASASAAAAAAAEDADDRASAARAADAVLLSGSVDGGLSVWARPAGEAVNSGGSGSSGSSDASAAGGSAADASSAAAASAAALSSASSSSGGGSASSPSAAGTVPGTGSGSGVVSGGSLERVKALEDSHEMGVTALCAASDVPGLFASCSLDSHVRLFGVRRSAAGALKVRQRREWRGNTLECFAGTFLERSQGRLFSVCGRSGRGLVLDLGEDVADPDFFAGEDAPSHGGPKVVGELSGSDAFMMSLACSADGRMLAAGAQDGGVFLYDAETLKTTSSLAVHARGVRSLAFSPADPWMLISASEDMRLSLTDTRAGTRAAMLVGHSSWVLSCAANPSGNLVASAGADRRVKVWDLAQRRILHTFNEHDDQVWDCAWVDDHTLASAGDDARVAFYTCRPTMAGR